MRHHTLKKINYEKGAAMLVTVIFALFISTTIIFGIAEPILKHAAITKSTTVSKKSYFLAEAALEDAIYRIKTGKHIVSGDAVTLDGSSASVSLTSTMNGKVVEASANKNGVIRKMESSLITGTGVAFNYGVQTGTGGFVLNGGSQINGNVYSNGNIVATNGVTITGSAIAANSPALTADQINDAPLPPPNSVKFRDTSATQDFAQSFQVSVASPINKISFYIKKVGSPADAPVRIVTDSSGSPGTVNMLTTQGTLTASSVTTAYGWVDVVLPSNPELDPSTTYWIVIDSGSNNASSYYVMGANSAYAGGNAKIGKYSGTWSATTPFGLDAYFKIYLGGLTSSIGGDTYIGGVQIGTGGSGIAWAHSVQGASVSGALYCQSGSNNNKACNTSRSDPAPQPFPISEANIQEWKDEAEAGGTISGNYTVGYAGATIGPKKITGNLVVNGGGTLTISGTLWVQGTISVTGGGKIRLDSTYGSGSGILLSDGYVNLAGGGQLTGSGFSGSYLLVVTTSDCPDSASCGGNNALSVSGGAGAVILSAQNGTMSLAGGVQARSATAYKITATGGTTITYDSGIANLNFSSGPSGGWEVSSWQEVP